MAIDSTQFYYFHPSDRVGSAATIAVETGTESTEYPAANLVNFTDAKIAAPAKVAEAYGFWQGDLGSAQRVDLAVIWHNGDENLKIKFQQHASTGSWSSSPTVNTSLTTPAKRADGYTRKGFIDLRSVSGYSTNGFRYFRIGVATSTPNSAAVGLKVLLYSQVRQVARGFQWGVEDDEHQVGIVQKTDAGVQWGYNLSAAPRSLRAAVTLTDTDAESMREWFRACAGGVTPTVIIPEPATNDAWLVHLSDGFSIGSPSLVVRDYRTIRQITNANQATIAVEEVTAGDPEWF